MNRSARIWETSVRAKIRKKCGCWRLAAEREGLRGHSRTCSGKSTRWISAGEMITRAREALRDCPNAFVYQNNGRDLQQVPDGPFDFAFSLYVFQHIPSYEMIESYIGEVGRLLKPGALFKFQAQGSPLVEVNPEETWVGVPISLEKARSMAARHNFELRYSAGEGTEEFWLWFFKR